MTEDRQNTGLALRLPIAHNITMANVGAHQPLGVLDLRAQKRALTADYIARAAHPRRRPAQQLAGRLSGGNQQKVVIAKWLFRDTRSFPVRRADARHRCGREGGSLRSDGRAGALRRRAF